MVRKPVVMLTMPRRNAMLHAGAAEGFYLFPTAGDYNIIRVSSESSLLTRSMNSLWSMGLNHRPDYFAMLHCDVAPERFWLDALIEEMRQVEADFISAILPIKTMDGDTSTAIDTDDVWNPRRLTMHEVHERPATFMKDEVDAALLVNTGLCVCDFRRDWVEKVSFKMMDAIECVDGEYQPRCFPEDWLFSRQMHFHGVRVAATRKVKAEHVGEFSYSNHYPWGRERNRTGDSDAAETQVQDPVHAQLSG